MNFANKYKRRSECQRRSHGATEMLVQPFSCECGSNGVLICLGTSAEAIQVSRLQLSNVAPQHSSANQPVAAGGCRHQLPTAIGCIARSRSATPSTSLERPNSAADLKFVTMCVFVMVDGKLQPIEGYMDTGACMSIMSESMAKRLKLNYKHSPPLATLNPFGEVSLEPIGFIPKVSLRTRCRRNVEEDFYVVRDNQMAEDMDAYLSLDLILRLEHLVRVACSECD